MALGMTAICRLEPELRLAGITVCNRCAAVIGRQSLKGCKGAIGECRSPAISSHAEVRCDVCQWSNLRQFACSAPLPLLINPNTYLVVKPG